MNNFGITISTLKGKTLNYPILLNARITNDDAKFLSEFAKSNKLKGRSNALRAIIARVKNTATPKKKKCPTLK